MGKGGKYSFPGRTGKLPTLEAFLNRTAGGIFPTRSQAAFRNRVETGSSLMVIAKLFSLVSCYRIEQRLAEAH